MAEYKEPLLHTAATDCLPHFHPLANQRVDCKICKNTLHAFNNECMQMWVETAIGNYCLKCFSAEVEADEIGTDEQWAFAIK